MPRHSKSFSARVRTGPLCNIALDKVNDNVQRLNITLTLLGLGLEKFHFNEKKFHLLDNKFQKLTLL